MVPYLGDFAEDATVYMMFNTFSSDDPSASCTITNFINTDIHIHKDDGLTQRNNAAGITVSVDFDSITGSHMIKIDTSDDTVAGFWVTGSDYFVRVEGTTIDGATVNAVVGHFSIENRFNEVDVTKWLGQACHAVSENGVPKVDVDQIAGVVQRAADLAEIAEFLIATTCTLTDKIADGSIIAQILATGGDISDYSSTTDALESIRDHIGDGTNLTEAGGDGDHLTEAGGDGDQLTAVPWNANWDAEVESEVTDSLVAHNLDHLMKTAVADRDAMAEVVDGTVLANIMTKTDGDTSDFDPDTDSLEAIRDKLTDIETDTAEIGAAGAGLTEAGGTGDQLTAIPDFTAAGTLSGIALDLMIDRIYTRICHEVNVTDATGAVAIRNAADDANIATGSITDDDTTTSQAKLTWS